MTNMQWFVAGMCATDVWKGATAGDWAEVLAGITVGVLMIGILEIGRRWSLRIERKRPA